MFNKNIQETFQTLNSSTLGLSDQEVKERQSKYGFNILKKDKKINPILIFFKQFIDPLVFVLLAGFVLSLLLKEYSDSIIIFIVVILNALLNFFQEYKAEKEVENLKQLSNLKSISLGPRILRTETAGMVLAGIVLYEFNEMG